MLISTSAHAAPILTTVSCDSSGLHTCLTSIDNFQVGDELYDVDFRAMNIVDAFDLDPTMNILEQFKPLEAALFWDDREEAEIFATALDQLIEAQGVDGFLCAGRCEFTSLGLPYGPTYIPVYLQTVTNVEVASCLVGTSPSSGEGFHFCFFNPGSNSQNWAVISRVPEPSTVATFGLGVTALTLLRKRKGACSRQKNNNGAERSVLLRDDSKIRRGGRD